MVSLVFHNGKSILISQVDCKHLKVIAQTTQLMQLFDCDSSSQKVLQGT